MSSDIVLADTLRRSRSTGDLPATETSRPDHAHSVHRHSTTHRLPPLLIPNDLESSFTDSLVLSPRNDWSPIIPRVLEEEHIQVHDMDLAPRRRRRLFTGVLAFFGLGAGNEARKELASLVFNLVWNSIQTVAIIVVLSLAAHIRSPVAPHLTQWRACNKPLGVWCSIWLIRANLSFVLAYWTWVRGRTPNNTSFDPESNHVPSLYGNPQNSSNRRAGGRRATASSRNNTASTLPHSRWFHRLTAVYSILTIIWFLAAHVFEYTSVYTCRISSPLLWWLTFSILSIMYLKILELAFLGIVVFIIAPILFLFWNIVLICLGRHPLQNPSTMMKPEIEKLPKSVVDAIPLVLYIPAPPEEGPIKYPPAAHAYPPKVQTPSMPKRRFRFLRQKSSKQKKKNVDGINTSKGDTSQAKGPANDEPETWEDYWEPGDYPFVRLENNRAACAICLVDFAEPKRIAGHCAVDASAQFVERDGEKVIVQESSISYVVEEERCDELKLTDAGEGPQPLRLLQCGHVFHKTCLDPWLQDVSGRCPLCQRAVTLPEPGKKKRRRWRR